MRIGERERLLSRVRQIREAGRTTGAEPASLAGDPRGAQLVDLERRVAHLERLLEGLQDSVHRESDRQSKRLGELETRIQPAALGESLSRDARERGL